MEKERSPQEISFLAKLRKSKAAQRQYTKLYNSLCDTCRLKVYGDTDALRGEGYKKVLCKKCVGKAEYRIDEVKRLIK